MSDYRAGSFVCCAAGCDRPKGTFPIACSINVGFGVGLAEWGSKSTFALHDSESHGRRICLAATRVKESLRHAGEGIRESSVTGKAASDVALIDMYPLTNDQIGVHCSAGSTWSRKRIPRLLRTIMRRNS